MHAMQSCSCPSSTTYIFNIPFCRKLEHAEFRLNLAVNTWELYHSLAKNTMVK